MKNFGSLFISRNFYFLWQGQFFSLFGDIFYEIIISFYMIGYTYSMTIVSLVLASIFIPKLIFFPISGVICEYIDKKFILIVTDFARGLLLILLSFYSYFNFDIILTLLIINISTSVLGSFYESSASSLYKLIIKKEDYLKANSIRTVSSYISQILGLLCGGIIYKVVNIEAIFFLNGVSFIISGIFECFLSLKNIAKQEKIELKSNILRVRIVINRLIADDLLKRFILINITVSFFISFLNIIYLKIFIPSDYSTALLVMMISGVFSIGLLNKMEIFKKNIYINFIISGVLLIFALLIFGFSFKITYYFLFILIGFSIARINAITITCIQKLIPKRFSATMYGFIFFLFTCCTPFGAIIGGVVCDVLPQNLIFFGSALVILLFTLFINDHKIKNYLDNLIY